MASHLTVISNTATGLTSKGLNGQAGLSSDAGASGMGAFASLLGAASQKPSTPSSSDTRMDQGAAGISTLAFEAGLESDQGDQSQDLDAIAAVLEVALPIQTPEAKAALVDLIDNLAELKLGLAAGDVDPELLKRINAGLDDLAAQLDIDLSKLTTASDLEAMLTSDDASMEARLKAALAPLAESLLAGAPSIDAEQSALAKSVGDKLAALLQSLNADDALATDAEVQAAIAKLNAPTLPVDATAEAQQLGAAHLKLTEPTLIGQSAENAPDAGLSAPKIAVSTADKPDRDGNQSQDKSSDAKAQAVAAAASNDTLPDPQANALNTHQASRIDAAAARPVVQAGYQTSQQQLNLPQLAFELVRQVNDGNTRFQMRLDPPELGKIDVKLDIDASGKVNARLTVEKAETLDLMQRDQRALERALQQAGLDSSKTNLEFSLKQSPFSGGNQQGQDGNGRQAFAGEAADADETPLPTINLYRGSLSASGVNIIA